MISDVFKRCLVADAYLTCHRIYIANIELTYYSYEQESERYNCNSIEHISSYISVMGDVDQISDGNKICKYWQFIKLMLLISQFSHRVNLTDFKIKPEVSPLSFIVILIMQPSVVICMPLNNECSLHRVQLSCKIMSP